MRVRFFTKYVTDSSSGGPSPPAHSAPTCNLGGVTCAGDRHVPSVQRKRPTESTARAARHSEWSGSTWCSSTGAHCSRMPSFATPPNDATCNRRRATDTMGCSHDAAGNIGRRWSLAVDGSRREHVRAAKELVRLQREGKIAHVAENRPLLHRGALYNA